MSEDPPIHPAEAVPNFDLQNKSPDEIVDGWYPVSAQWEKDYREMNYEGAESGTYGYAPTRDAELAYAEQAKAVVESDPDKARALMEQLGSAAARRGSPDTQEQENAQHDQKLLGHLLVGLSKLFPQEALPLWSRTLSSRPFCGSNPARWELSDAVADQKLPPKVLADIVFWVTGDLKSRDFESP